MRYYFIDVHIKSFLNECKTDATTKPRTDAIKIAKKVGFKPIVLYYWETSIAYIQKKHPLFPNRLLNIQLWLLCKYVRNSVILLQTPFFRHNLYDVLGLLKRRNKLIILIHDVDILRYSDGGEFDFKMLMMADVLVVHSPEMKGALYEMGVKAPCVALEFFDYLNDCERIPNVSKNNPRVVFAGNLQKSTFLSKLVDIPLPEMFHLNLYGRPVDYHFPENVHYKSFFDNEHISEMEGDWGLVWDGDSIDTCSGVLGTYLRYNASFKFSLYLACGIPVIVWTESALAQYVEKYHLGICVKALHEIPKAIASLSPDEVSVIQEGLALYSSKVKTGGMLHDAIQKGLGLLKTLPVGGK